MEAAFCVDNRREIDESPTLLFYSACGLADGGVTLGLDDFQSASLGGLTIPFQGGAANFSNTPSAGPLTP
ncbi:hypothetical protein [Methylocystis sp. SB2]|nr:hypothetical protein [Methylocystis sp. SB2]ULO25584.1 hypothetical protein LNB28_16880 [Methylocystis sp. SB2]